MVKNKIEKYLVLKIKNDKLNLNLNPYLFGLTSFNRNLEIKPVVIINKIRNKKVNILGNILLSKYL